MIVAVLVHVVGSVATLQQIAQQNGIIRERPRGSNRPFENVCRGCSKC